MYGMVEMQFSEVMQLVWLYLHKDLGDFPNSQVNKSGVLQFKRQKRQKVNNIKSNRPLAILVTAFNYTDILII